MKIRKKNVEDYNEQSSIGLHTRYENVKQFWTKREYEYQELITNGIVVHRETPGKYLRATPFARIDIFYDGPNGLGRKAMNGVEFKVYKEASKFLSDGELNLLNINWRKAKYEGKYKFEDPFCRHPIYDKSLPDWIVGKGLSSGNWSNDTKRLTKKIKDKVDKAVKESEASLNKRINDYIKNLNYKEPEEKVKPSPLQDLFLTKDIDPKEVVGDENLSTLYKHIKGDRELSKTQAIKYARTLGVAPATLMFEPKTINVWSNVKLSSKIETPDGSAAILPGECYQRNKIEVSVCPSDIYRLDIKAIRVNDPNSIYNGFMAYYYETNNISDQANNKLCMIREATGKTLLEGSHKYYLGIYQLYGAKKRILNPDPTSDIKVLAEDIEPDVVAPIVSFTDPGAILVDKVLSKNIKQVQQLGELIRKERQAIDEQSRKTLTKIEQQIKELNIKIEAQNKQRLFPMPPGLLSTDDDILIPKFLKKDEKKRA